MTSEEIKDKLKQRNLKQVSRETGLPYSRIYNFVNKDEVKIYHDDALVIIKYLSEK